MSYTFNIYQTLALAAIAVKLGAFIRKKIPFFERFCIPAPVIGGLIFANVSYLLYVTGVMEFVFDETVREVFMVFFFTSIGFQIDLKILKAGGKSVVIYLLAMILLITTQNLVALGLSKVLGINSLVGMCTGSISMVGGHGTSEAFGPMLEDLGLKGATTFCTAAATYGLIAGSLIGGPIGNSLIKKKNLLKSGTHIYDNLLQDQENGDAPRADTYAPAVFLLVITVGIGTIVSWILAKIGLTFPIYVGGMIIALIVRAISEFTGKYSVPVKEIDDMGGIFLNLFLGAAMIALELWQLTALALPLIILLAVQTIIMILFARFILFNMMGRDYDSAVICAGTCGFGLGATPNAMANMQTICQKYRLSAKAFLLVPLIGGFINDFTNSMIITFFLNVIK